MSEQEDPRQRAGEGEALVEELTAEGRARIREGLAAQRKRPDRHARGLVIVHTGHGKGKTTAALGLVMRAWGREMRVIVLQFIKHQTANTERDRVLKCPLRS